MPVRDWGLAYSQFAIFFEDRLAAWRLLRTLSSNSWGLSAPGISGEEKEKQLHFCNCSSPFYSAACVGSLLSVALFGCKYSIVEIVVGNSFTRFKIHTPFGMCPRGVNNFDYAKLDIFLSIPTALIPSFLFLFITFIIPHLPPTVKKFACTFLRRQWIFNIL